MRSGSLSYWSRGNSTDLTISQQNQSPIHNSPSFRKECKVSPRMHKLNDPERSNLPAQTYQRLCKRIPNTKTFINDENAVSTIPMNPHVDTNMLKQLNLASSKTTSSSKKSILKSPELSRINQNEAELYNDKSGLEDPKGVFRTPKQVYQRNEDYGECSSPKPAWTKKLSPRGNVSPFNEFSSVKTHLLQDKGNRKGKEQFYSQRGDGEGFYDQQLTFRTNTGTDVEEVSEAAGETVRFGRNWENEKEFRYVSNEKAQQDYGISSKKAGECGKDEGDYGIRMRQKSMQWTPKEKIVGSLDVLSCAKALFQSAKTERGNIKYSKPEQTVSGYEDGETSELKEMILELKKKVNQKQNEVLSMKNKTKMNKIQNEELEEKLNQAVMAKKRSEDMLEKLTQRIGCNEREIIFLNKCKERLVDILPNQEDYGNDVQKCLKKMDEYQVILNNKEQEAQVISLEVQRLEQESQEKIETGKNQGKMEVRKLALELKVRTEEIKQLREAIENIKAILKVFDKVGEKMIDLEANQNRLIIENDRLKNLLPEKEKQKFQKYLEAKTEASRVIQTSTAMNVIDEYAQNLTKIFEAMSKGKEPSLDSLALFKNEKNRKGTSSIERTTLSRDIDLNELVKTNAQLSEVVYHRFMKYMDEICEQYARACGSHCNVQ